MFKLKKKKKNKQESLLHNEMDINPNAQNPINSSFNYLANDVDDHHQEMVQPNKNNKNNQPIHQPNANKIDKWDKQQEKDKSKCVCCSWKCVCLVSTLTISIIIVIISIILYLIILPNIAQNTLNQATMSIINGTIYNPTNKSITLNTSILLSNTGMFNGKLHETEVYVYNNNILIGTMIMPQMKTIGNQNSIVSVMSILNIENVTQFQISCKELLQNKDQVWKLSANNVLLTVDIGFLGTYDFNLNINKDLILPGANLYNFIGSSFNIDSATNNTIHTSSDINFISHSIFTFILPDTLMNIYLNGTYIGYTRLNQLIMQPGYNVIRNQSLIIESFRYNKNRNLLNIFFSKYIMNVNQKVTMKGPVSDRDIGYKSLVIDGILEETIICLGYKAGTLAFGGLVTSATQTGWKVNDKTVRGAYSNMLNPLNVPIRIVNMSGNAYLKEFIEYDVTLLYVDKYKCPSTNKFGSLSIGEGIYKNNPSKTWVDVEANGKTTFFAIGEPMSGSGDRVNSTWDGCLHMFPFSCCFATLPVAYICKLNPQIQKDKSGQLDYDYMPLELESNITMLIDNKFKIRIFYRQSFFPLFYGYEVYAGYLFDAEISCSDFTFH